MAEALAIWLYGLRVAVVTSERRRLRLSYTDNALKHYSLGTPLLSLSLPLTSERYPHGVVRPFLDGLLPEGEARRAIASDFDLLASDTFGLIRALGRDCAGALVVQPDDEQSPPSPTTLAAVALADEEIADLVANLRSSPLGAGARVRISLAGVQEKLLLTRLPEGRWGRPMDGTPSTHIIKPEISRFADTVENEAFCMRFAKHLGLSVADVETIEIQGRHVIVIERYDRTIHQDGTVERIHQEDFCQAMSLLPEKKYEEDGGPSLLRIAEILQAAAGLDSLEALLRALTVNVLIGNGDAHGKNISLLHAPSGALRLAPLYDLMSTLVYGDDRLAMYIDDIQRTNRVTTERMLNEAARWGLAKPHATEIVYDVLDRAPDAIKSATEQTEGVPAEILAILESQLGRLRSTFSGARTKSVNGS